jgi:hypothetical protein
MIYLMVYIFIGCELACVYTGNTRTAFFKMWSADHKWFSGSALVVLGLIFYEINYPVYIDVLLLNILDSLQLLKKLI